MANLYLMLVFGLAAVAQGSFRPDSPWTQINDGKICFEGRGSKYGTLHYSGMNSMVGALKLVHREGLIRCANNVIHNSHWGCPHISFLLQHPMNVVVTDISNHIIYPAKKYFKPGVWGFSHGLWYYLPTASPNDKELVFTNYETPFYLRRGATLRIWYGEDLKNFYEADNSGRVCVDVFAHLL